MKTACVVFAVLFVLASAFEDIQIPEPESPESLAARPFEKRDCFKDTHEGREVCLALFYRYKWSVGDQDCVKAIYGGCHETKNNFETLEECRKVAGPVCKSS